MKFRTEIDIKRNRDMQLSHTAPIVMLGSCFTDNVGALLARDGFNVTANPMGTLYNPLSLANAINKSMRRYRYTAGDIELDENGLFHCLDFCTQYTASDIDSLTTKATADIEALRNSLRQAETLILTLGTAFVFSWIQGGKNYVVGNCHKFPAACFNRHMISADEVTGALNVISYILPANVKNIILTVSPIRHTGDGLHGNQLSKATLLLGIEKFLQQDNRQNTAYFPSYEIMIDDLRDYRFYSADMKHPSDVAIEYIYQVFCETFVSPEALATAVEARRLFQRTQHRQITNID